MNASDRWSAQRNVLAVEALRSSGRLRLQVSGESMLPTFWPGDVAEIQTCSVHEVRGGEIVLAFREGRFFLHRFLKRSEPDNFLARGDSMPKPDPAYSADALLGKIVSVVRAGQPVSLAPRRWSRALGWLLCHCNLARRIALRLRASRHCERIPGANPENA